ncbi:hypothetical protein FYJ38_24415 [Clostridium sp. WB02_MRS01]|uniref:hypothetical protein n=1 Tax=Clostridium sp. WB02_MRS01 TaxID=2605777 RepID=UPI0012B22765|nr:hypothetical protein [Clostridium sp. WB02_MRS01]MSS11754.1 hypothetical protein [Clostridium sp. WB02_MRS01]
MKNLSVTWKGISPLIMHSCQCVNPLHPISKELKKYTEKKSKQTEEDLIRISDLEWESGAYWKEGLGLYIPGENVEATIRNGAKVNRKGKDIEKYVNVTDLYIPFNYGENLSKEELIQNYEYRDTRIMVINRSRILRTRPRFDQWNITFNLMYNEEKLDLDTVVNAIEYAGQYIGLCDSRPKYGKFVATIEELD